MYISDIEMYEKGDRVEVYIGNTIKLGTVTRDWELCEKIFVKLDEDTEEKAFEHIDVRMTLE